MLKHLHFVAPTCMLVASIPVVQHLETRPAPAPKAVAAPLAEGTWNAITDAGAAEPVCSAVLSLDGTTAAVDLVSATDLLSDPPPFIFTVFPVDGSTTGDALTTVNLQGQTFTFARMMDQPGLGGLLAEHDRISGLMLIAPDATHERFIRAMTAAPVADIAAATPDGRDLHITLPLTSFGQAISKAQSCAAGATT